MRISEMRGKTRRGEKGEEKKKMNIKDPGGEEVSISISSKKRKIPSI